ncbi:MAG: hypothetical protein GPJ54_14975 [Candidatus Heimdallarchaeota archaeon]|nr:hypothetical protein [Candidatus Heimdallarchaeota archaeon]
MDNNPTSRESKQVDDISIWLQNREPVFRGMYFYDDPNINITKDLNYGFQEFASKVWMESYGVFEADIRTVIDYISTLCKNNQIELKENKNYNLHLDLLVDLQALSNHQLLKLKKLNLKEIEELSHDYRLRMTFGEMVSYIKNRNIVYLVFITLLQYSISVDEEYKYLVLVLSFLILLNKSDDLTSMDRSYQVLDISVYELSKMLSLNNQRRFEHLVVYGSQIHDQKGIDNVIIQLLPILLSGFRNNNLEDLIGFMDHLVLQLFSSLSNKQIINMGLQQINVKINMESVDLKRTSPEIFSGSIPNQEVLQNLVTTKANSDRFKSEYSRSQISKHQINTLLSQKNTCLLEWLSSNCDDYLIMYHIHEKLNSGDLIECNLGIQMSIVDLYRISPMVGENQISIELEVHRLINANSNLLFQSRPGYVNEKFSPKIGLSPVRIHPSIIIDDKTNIFTKNDRLNLNVYQSREPIFEIIRSPNQKQEIKLSLAENLALLEQLIESDIIKKYQIDNFQNKIVIFLVLDFIQQQNLLENRVDISEKLTSLFQTQDLLTVLLI